MNRFLLKCLCIAFTLPPIMSALGINAKAADIVGCPLSSGTGFNISQTNARWGETVTISICLINSSSTGAGASKTQFYLSTDSSITTNDYPLGDPVSVDPIAAHGTLSGSVGVALPKEGVVGSSGTFYIGAIHDALNQVAEDNGGESNNSNQGEGIDWGIIAISPPDPDLKGWDGRPNYDAYFDVQEKEAVWGDSIHLRFSVINNSYGNCGAFTVKFYLSPNPTFGDGNDHLLQPVLEVDKLDALRYTGFEGVYHSFNLPEFNPLSGSSTTVYVGMVVDSEQQVHEPSESNNSSQGNGIDWDYLKITNPKPKIQISDSVAPTNDRLIDFGDVLDDGQGGIRGVESVIITNGGRAALRIASIKIQGNDSFKIIDSVSSINGANPLENLPDLLSPRESESWTVRIEFDPKTTSTTTATLAITDDGGGRSSVTLRGTGKPTPDIAIKDKSGVEDDLSVDYGGVLNDGTGGEKGLQTLSLENEGSGDLTISQGGISLLSGTAYSLISITSNLKGSIDLSTAPAIIAPRGIERWDIVVAFDPPTSGQADDGLQIRSNDPDEGTVNVSLTGKGLLPMNIQVTDSSLPKDDLNIEFPGTHADGEGGQIASATVVLENTGEAALTIPENGIYLFLNGPEFQIQSVESNTQGTIDLSKNSVELAGEQKETWTITVIFDPTAPEDFFELLQIQSDDPDEAAVGILLWGGGLEETELKIVDSQGESNDKNIEYGFVLNDGTGNRKKEEPLTLSNIGTHPLVIERNGILFEKGSAYSIVGITSSTDGAVNLASTSTGVRTISGAGTETWTVNLAFDPISNATVKDTLRIRSNDTHSPVKNVTVSGTGEEPHIAHLLKRLETTTNVSAGSAFEITWEDLYRAGDAQIEFFLDADTDPTEGLVSIAKNISEDDPENLYAWQPDSEFEGKEYYIYGKITDGGVSRGVYSTHKIKIDPEHSFHLRSASKTTSATYAYEFEYKGRIYTGTTELSEGANMVNLTVLLPGGEKATLQFEVERVDSLLEKQSASYDSLNRIKTVTNGNGIVTTLTYDDLGRIVKSNADNGNFVEYKYGSSGQRSEMHDPTGYTFYDHDDLRRLEKISYSKNATKGDSDDLVIRYSYDLENKLTSMIYPGGEEIHYSYDAGHFKTCHNITQGLLTTYHYDPASGQLTDIIRPNGVTTSFKYDEMGRVNYIKHERSGSLILELDYDLNALGAVESLTTTLPGGVTRKEAYDYDDLDRLIKVIYSNDETIDANDKTVTYTYDGAGNRLTMKTEEGGSTQKLLTYEYGNENRLLKITDQEALTVAEFRYDAAGNRIQKITPEGTTLYDYDERGLLTRVSTGDTLVSFVYNGDAQRVSKTVNGKTTRFVIDPNRGLYDVIQERSNSNSILRSFTYAGDRLSENTSGSNAFFLTDRLGSVRKTTDANGTVIDSTDFDAFGIPVNP